MQSTGQIIPVNGLKEASCISKVDIVDPMQPSTTTLEHVTSTAVCTTDCRRAVSTQYSSCVIPALGTTGRSFPIKKGTHYTSKAGSKNIWEFKHARLYHILESANSRFQHTTSQEKQHWNWK